MKELIKYKKTGIFQLLLALFFFILTFGILLQSPLNIFSDYGISSTDSSVFRTVALSMQNGGMPYSDSFDHKGPLLYILNFIGTLMLEYKGIWIIEFLFIFITFVFIYKIARFFLTKFYSMGIVLITGSLLSIFLEGGNLAEEYALPFIASSLYIFLDYFLNSKVTIFRLIFSGFSFAAVCLLRINMFSPWIAFGFIILVKTLIKKEYTDLKKIIKYFIIGVCILAIPIVIWLLVNGSFFDFIDAYFTFNFGYSSTGNAATVLNNIIEKNLGLRLSFLSEKNQIFNVISSIIIFLMNPVIFISFLYILQKLIKEKNYFNVAYLLYFLSTIFLIAMGGRAYFHYGVILVPLISYPLSQVIFLCQKNLKSKKNVLLLGIIIITFLGMSFIGAKKSFNSCKILNDESNIKIQIAKYVKDNSSEDSCISVFGNDNIIYILSERRPASKYSYQLPIGNVKPEIMKEYFSDLRLNNPEIIVLTSITEDMKNFLIENDYYLEKQYAGAQIYIKWE